MKIIIFMTNSEQLHYPNLGHNPLVEKLCIKGRNKTKTQDHISLKISTDTKEPSWSYESQMLFLFQ